MTPIAPRGLMLLAAALSLLAALIHVLVMPEHFDEWWGYGAFFLVVAIAQALYAVALLRGTPSPGLIGAGVLGNLALIGLWAWTRTLGIPLVGPHAGEVEAIGAIDVVAKIVEALLIAGLILLLRVDAGFGTVGGEVSVDRAIDTAARDQASARPASPGLGQRV